MQPVSEPGEQPPESPAEPVVENKEGLLQPPAPGIIATKEGLLEYVRKHALSRGYAITIRKSNPGKNIYIACDRGGEYKPQFSTSPGVKRRQTSSRKCGCPFALYGKRQRPNTTWELRVTNPAHNHAADPNMIAHPSARRLTAEQRRHIKHLNEIGTKPREIMTFLKLENPNALLISRDIYNELAKLKKEKEKALPTPQVMPSSSV